MKAINCAHNKLVRHRERLRAAGLRPVHFWVPDTCTPEFAALLRMQCLQLAKDLAETEVLGFTEQVATHIDSWHWIGNGYECAKTNDFQGWRSITCINLNQKIAFLRRECLAVPTVQGR